MVEKILWIIVLVISSGYIGYYIGKRKNKPDKTYKWIGRKGDYTCGCCGQEAPNDGYYASPFCYECGAKHSMLNEE